VITFCVLELQTVLVVTGSMVASGLVGALATTEKPFTP
jgi:hypothetical protein